MDYTQEDVDEILEAYKKSTPGPWFQAQESIVRKSVDHYVIADIMTGENRCNDTFFISGAPILAEEVLRLRKELQNYKA